MNQHVENGPSFDQESHEAAVARKQAMEATLAQATEVSLDLIPEEHKMDVRKALEAQKGQLLDLLREERGPERLTRRMEWLSLLEAELLALQKDWPNVPVPLAEELKRFMEKSASRFMQEAEERMKEKGTTRAQALHETFKTIFSRVGKTAQDLKTEAALYPLTEEEKRQMYRAMAEREEQLRMVQNLPPTQRADFQDAYGDLLEKIAKLDQRLDPEKPINTIDIALMNPDAFDTATGINKTLYPFTAEAKRRSEEHANAEHKILMAQRRVAQEQAAGQGTATQTRSARPVSSEARRSWWKFWQKNEEESLPRVEI